MARSKIIKDFINSNISTEIVLRHLRVLLNDIEDKSLIDWVSSELMGYRNNLSSLPDYRKLSGVLKADCIVGYTKYSDYLLPLSHLDPETKDLLLNVSLGQSISALENIVNDDNPISKYINSELFPLIQKGCNAQVVSARVSVDISYIRDVLSTVNNKILEILLLLENEFGNLDNLDIDISIKKSDDLKTIIKNLNMTIYDNSINIGDNNTIKKSNLISNCLKNFKN